MKSRDKIGAASVAICGIAIALWYTRPHESTAALIFLRAGLVLGAIWLAWSDLVRIPRWLSIGGVITMILVARFPMLATIIVPALFIFRWAMKGSSLTTPRLSSKSNTQSRQEKSRRIE